MLQLCGIDHIQLCNIKFDKIKLLKIVMNYQLRRHHCHDQFIHSPFPNSPSHVEVKSLSVCLLCKEQPRVHVPPVPDFVITSRQI